MWQEGVFNLDYVERYHDRLIPGRYSPNTIRTYTACFKDFLTHFSDQNPGTLTSEQVNQYLLGLIRGRAVSSSQQNQRINAIKFYFEKVLGRGKQSYELPRPHKEHKLPKVLSKNEVKRIASSFYPKTHSICSVNTI